MTLQELLQQKADLERRISTVQSETRAQALERIRMLMRDHGVTLADLSASGKTRRAGAKVPAPVKYRDEAGNTWSGRGLKPRWLQAAIAAGKSAEDFAV